MLIEINDVAKFGSIRDQEGYELPPEAFTYANNVRFTNQGAERIQGRPPILGTPLEAPHFAIAVQSATETFWLYTSLTKAYAIQGLAHTDITRLSGDYTATATKQWNGTLLGGVPILNNGPDVPQYWASLSVATKLADLPAWPTFYRTKVMRAFGPHLFALYIVKGPIVAHYPHMVKWSHPADPGTVPISWDETDETRDAGETDLPDVEAGVIQNGLPLSGRFYIYKEASVWRVTFVGGQFIFLFEPFLTTAGLLTGRALTTTSDGAKHVFATQDGDIMIHNGTAAESVLDQRFKKFLGNTIDTANFDNSFMFTDPVANECWFCYPEPGVINPNRAVVWNSRLGTLYESDVNFRNAASGHLQEPRFGTWEFPKDVAGPSWDDATLPWNSNYRRAVVLCDTDESLFLQLDQGAHFNLSNYTGTLQRIGLGVIGRKRTGEWIVDFARHKMLTRVWLKASGGLINVKVGFQERPDGPVTWMGPKVFDPATDKYVDFTGSGKALAVEFSAANPFRILGYKPEIVLLGTY